MYIFSSTWQHHLDFQSVRSCQYFWSCLRWFARKNMKMFLRTIGYYVSKSQIVFSHTSLRCVVQIRITILRKNQDQSYVKRFTPKIIHLPVLQRISLFYQIGFLAFLMFHKGPISNSARQLFLQIFYLSERIRFKSF